MLGMKTQPINYQRHRFPAEIISHAVWLYHRFCLSFREVEELLAERRIIVTYESIRRWCLKFGPAYARRLKKRQGRLGDVWHLDEASSPFTGSISICGARSIKMGTPLISWCSDDAINKRRCASSAAYSKAKEANPAGFTPINSAVMTRLTERSCRPSNTSIRSTPTIELKSRISRRGNKNITCAALLHDNRLNDFSRSTDSRKIFSALAATSCRR